MANYKPVGSAKVCNKFTIGDRLDKSVQDYIEKHSGTMFLLEKTDSGFRVTPFIKEVAPVAVAHAKQEKRNGRQGAKRKQSRGGTADRA
jgi:NMD protein affecting ribosome stability and mRNA decay